MDFHVDFSDLNFVFGKSNTKQVNGSFLSGYFRASLKHQHPVSVWLCGRQL